MTDMGKFILDSKEFGEMELNEEEGVYACEADWLGHTVRITMPAEAEDILWNFAVLEQFYSEREGWDSHLRKNAADQLLEMAKSADPSITAEEFIRRLTPKEVRLITSTMVCMVYSDGGMLGGVDLTVYAPFSE